MTTVVVSTDEGIEIVYEILEDTVLYVIMVKFTIICEYYL